MEWSVFLASEQKKEYYVNLENWIKRERENGVVIFPEEKDIFNAFKYCHFDNIKVVILGQDPYHEKGQAHGLCFSVQDGVKIPKSLVNIFKELEREYQLTLTQFRIPKSGCLTKWAKQGVFLLNTVLTVEEGKANSHAKKGWEIFTDNVIKAISEKKSNVVFMLWGEPAKKKKVLISGNQLVLESSHPSPLSCYHGFSSCNHFLLANEYLKKHNQKEIEWNLE